MFYTLKNGKITWSSEFYLSEAWTITIERNFTIEENKRISVWALISDTWEVEDTEEIQKKLKMAEIDVVLELNYDEYAKLEKLSVKTPEQLERFAYLQAAKAKLESDKQTLLNQV